MDEPVVDVKVGDRVKWKRSRRCGYATGRVYDILGTVAVIEGDHRWFHPSSTGTKVNVQRYKVPIERIVRVLGDEHGYAFESHYQPTRVAVQAERQSE